MGFFSFFNNKRRQLRRRRRNNADSESDREEPANVESEEAEPKEEKVEYILSDTDNDSNESVTLLLTRDRDEEDPDLSFERTDQQDDEEDLELDMGFERADLQDDEENPKVDFKEYILPTKEELEQELRLPEEDLLSKLEKRMDDITFILKNSELYTFDNKSLREDFVDQYIADVFFSTKITKCAFKRLVELLGAGQTVDMLGTISDMSHTCICINHWKAQIGDVVADFRDNNVKYKRIFWCDDVFVTNVKKKKDLRRLASYKKAILRF